MGHDRHVDICICTTIDSTSISLESVHNGPTAHQDRVIMVSHPSVNNVCTHTGDILMSRAIQFVAMLWTSFNRNGYGLGQ